MMPKPKFSFNIDKELLSVDFAELEKRAAPIFIEDREKLRENVRRNMGYNDHRKTYTCRDRAFSPFKTGCGCGVQFHNFNDLIKHVKAGPNNDNKGPRLPSNAAEFFDDTKTPFDAEL